MTPDELRARLEKIAKSDPDPARRAQAAKHYEAVYGGEEGASAPAPPTDPADAAAAQGDSPGWLARAASAVGKTAAQEGNAVASMFGLTDPSEATLARRKAIRPAMAQGAYAAGRDYSMGIAPAITDPIMDALGASSPEQRAKQRAESPTADAVGSGAGAAASAIRGPAQLIDKTVTAAGKNLLGPLADKFAGRLATNTASGAVVGGAQGGNEGAETGAILGAGGTLVGEAAKLGGRAVRGASQYVDDFARAKQAGAYENPQLAGAPKGTEGVQKVAEGVRDRIFARMEQLGADQKKEYAAAIAPYLQKGVNRDKAIEALNVAYHKNLHPDTEVPLDAGFAKAIEDTIKELYQAEPTLAGVSSRMGRVREEAGYQNPSPSPENVSARKLYSSLDASIDSSVGPEVQAARGQAASNAKGHRRYRDIMLRSEGNVSRGAGPEDVPGEITTVADEMKPGDMRVQKETQAARFLKRVGDDNVPGNEAKSYLEELAAADPEFARQIELLRAKKAQEAVRPSMRGQTPQSLTGAVEAGGWGPLIYQQGRTLGAHVLEPGMGAAAALAPKASRLPMLRDPADALMGRRKKKKGAE